MRDYDIMDWYWLETATGRVYSSAQQIMTDETNEGYKEFLEDGNTPTKFCVDPDGNESEYWLRRLIEMNGIQFLKNENPQHN